MSDNEYPKDQPPPVDQPPMTPAAKLNAAMNGRGVDMKPCSVCGEKDSFGLTTGYFVAGVSPVGNAVNIGGHAMPLLTACCQKCGNTIFLNALVLGLGNNLFEKAPENVSS